MILTGDFFQLPPTTGGPIYHDALKSVGILKKTKKEQEEDVTFPKKAGVDQFKLFKILNSF